MNAVIHTVAFRGLDTVPVSVQAHLSNGLPAMTIVGLADKAVAESKERIRAALSSMGLSLPAKRIAINLALAEVMSHAEIAEKVVAPAARGQPKVFDSIGESLTKTIEKLDITGRGYEKIMRVARTIANLDNSAEIQKHHIQEAIAYRKMRLVL